MALTRKYYNQMAEILAQARTRKDIIEAIATFFKYDNPMFDRAYFIDTIKKLEKKNPELMIK